MTSTPATTTLETRFAGSGGTTGIVVPPEAVGRAGAFVATLSNRLQRYHVDTVTAAKTAETCARRIDKAVALLRSRQER